MKTITYNPETHVLVPREPSQGMIDAMPPVEEIGYWAMYEAAIAAAPQPEPNPNWCAGCSPDNCSGCGTEPVAYIAPQPDRMAELEAALKVAREIAIDAATSLETIAIRSYGEDSYLDSKPQMRAFAQARASIAMEELTRINEVIGE